MLNNQPWKNLKKSLGTLEILGKRVDFCANQIAPRNGSTKTKARRTLCGKVSPNEECFDCTQAKNQSTNTHNPHLRSTVVYATKWRQLSQLSNFFAFARNGFSQKLRGCVKDHFGNPKHVVSLSRKMNITPFTWMTNMERSSFCISGLHRICNHDLIALNTMM